MLFLWHITNYTYIHIFVDFVIKNLHFSYNIYMVRRYAQIGNLEKNMINFVYNLQIFLIMPNVSTFLNIAMYSVFLSVPVSIY